MHRQAEPSDGQDRVEQLMARIQMPLENIEYTIQEYLLQNGARLDPETRFLLARVRDSVGRIAVSSRHLCTAEMEARERRPHLAYPAA